MNLAALTNNKYESQKQRVKNPNLSNPVHL